MTFDSWIGVTIATFAESVLLWPWIEVMYRRRSDRNAANVEQVHAQQERDQR